MTNSFNSLSGDTSSDDEANSDGENHEEAKSSSKEVGNTSNTSSDKTLMKGNASGGQKSIVRDRPSSCVFVASLTSSLSDDDLCMAVIKYFSKWGVLGTVKVLRDPHNRPYAFVQYNNDKDAKKAIAEAHNTVLEGRTIRCEHAKVNRTLFISNEYQLAHSKIKTELEVFGEIEKLLPSTEKGYLILRVCEYSKYWFCKFAYREDAIRAFANIKSDRSRCVEWAQNIDDDDEVDENNDGLKSSEPTFDKQSIFVGLISLSVTKDALYERFSLHGEIIDIILSKRLKNNFAFIKYRDEVSAARAVEKENHSMFQEKTMHVQYRELHNPKQKYHAYSPKVHGLALAPSPINFNRRVNGTMNKKIPLLELTGTYSKFHNKSQYQNRQQQPLYDLFKKPSNVFYLRGSGSYSKFVATSPSKTKRKSIDNPNSPDMENSNNENTMSPAASEISSTSPTITKTYSASSIVKSEKSDAAKYGKENIPEQKQQAKQPYFYYIPTNEIGPGGIPGGYGGAPPHPPPPQNFYNPYPYYIPYEGAQDYTPGPVPYYQYYYPQPPNNIEQ